MGANRSSACATTVRILQCAELTAGRSAYLDNYVNTCVVESSGRSWALCVAFTWVSCDICLEDAYIEEACWKESFGKAIALHLCTVRLDGHDALLQHGDEIMGPLSRVHSYYWRVGEGAGAFHVKTTPQMTRFRDVKVCNKLDTDEIDDHRIQFDYKCTIGLQYPEGKNSIYTW